MKNLVKKIKSVLPRNFDFCDVGARFGVEEPWIFFRDMISVISFEPDEEEYESLMKNKDSSDQVYPYALCNEKKTCLYI